MLKKVSLILFLFLIIAFGSFVLVKAVDDVPPPKICGDGIVQSPNDEDPQKFEKCDEGANNGLPTSSCTATCGQKMLGWGWSSNIGWVSLTCQNHNGCADHEYYVQETEYNTIKGWAWSNTVGWLCFGETCVGLPAQYGTAVPAEGWIATVRDLGSENKPIEGWGKFIALGDDGWVSLSCNNSPEHCDVSDYQVKSILGSFESGPRFTLQGMAGWNSTAMGGVGWIEFNPKVQKILPWLQTKYGDIYARSGLTGVEAPSFNATYRILSGGQIEKFTSARGINFVDENFGPVDFPTPQTNYSNILGNLDLNRLLCDGIKDKQSCINNYGRTVLNITSRPACVNQPCVDNPLDNKVYYYNGDMVINQNFEFDNSTDFISGAGTIVVDGDLVINANLTYDGSNNLSKFRNLASVAWIVKGDLKIAGNVNNLAGNFIVIGDGQSKCNENIDTQVSGCGEIHSCYSYTQDSSIIESTDFITPRSFASVPAGTIYPYQSIDIYSTYELPWVSPGNALASDDSDSVASSPDGSIPTLPSDETYATNYFVANNMGINLPANLDKITGIEVCFERKGDDVISYDALFLKKADGSYTNSYLTGVGWDRNFDRIDCYGGNGELWNETWTKENIENPNFGLAFRSRITGGSTRPSDRDYLYIDHVQVKIYYSVISEMPLVNSCQNRLTVSGLMMARKFYLEREFAEDDPYKAEQGSEVIIYDGRLLANTPPGLGDFAKALPIWRSDVFSQ